MDVIWFIAGLVIGTFVGALIGYACACLAILRKTSIGEWERVHGKLDGRDEDGERDDGIK